MRSIVRGRLGKICSGRKSLEGDLPRELASMAYNDKVRAISTLLRAAVCGMVCMLAISGAASSLAYAHGGGGDHSDHNEVDVEAFKKALHSEEVTPEIEALLTPKNFRAYFHHLVAELESLEGVGAQPETLTDFWEVRRTLADFAEAEVETRASTPLMVRILAVGWKQVIEHLAEAKDGIFYFSKKAREVAIRWGLGKFAPIFVAVEIAENLVSSAIVATYGHKYFWVFFVNHPNEYVVLPSFIIYNAYRIYAARKKIAGDAAIYRRLIALRAKLLRGDPQLIVAREKMMRAMSISGSALAFSVSKSGLPDVIPPWIRKLHDHRLEWHDLNFSIDELKDILGDEPMVNELMKLARNRPGLFAHLLIEGIAKDSRARIRFALFAGYRYFKALYKGDLPDELRGEMAARERRMVELLKARWARFRELSGESRYASFDDLAASLFAVTRLVQLDPRVARMPGFWNEVADLLATRTPGKKGFKRVFPGRSELSLEELVPFDILGEAKLLGREAPEKMTLRQERLFEWLQERRPGRVQLNGALSESIYILTSVLKEKFPDSFSGVHLPYEFKLSSQDSDSRRLAATRDAVASFVDVNRDILSVGGAVGELADVDLLDQGKEPMFEPLPVFSRDGGEGAGNLVKDLELFNARTERRLLGIAEVLQHELEEFEARSDYKANKAFYKDAGKVYWGAYERIEKELRSVRDEVVSLQFEWVKVLDQRQASPDNERGLPEYHDVFNRYAAYRLRAEAKFEALGSILKHMENHVADRRSGSIHFLKLEIGELLELGEQSHLLGMGICRTFLTEKAALLNRAKAHVLERIKGALGCGRLGKNGC